MSRRLDRRVAKLARRIPPPPPAPGPGEPTPEELDRMSTKELQCRLAKRFAAYEASEKGRRRNAELCAMTDQQLLAEWEKMPRYRDVPPGRR